MRARWAAQRLAWTLLVAASAEGISARAAESSAHANAAQAAACGASLPVRARQMVSAGALRLAFAPRTWPVPVGRHFAIDIVLCAPAGGAPPVLVGVDADMPVHRHGMNYRASVTAHGQGRYTAQGLMFHMPGRWRFLFDVNGRPLVHEVDVE